MWVLIIPFCLIFGNVLMAYAIIALENREPEEGGPCEHPWYIDGRCMVCGTPK